jgi:hypothetical protein
MHLRSPKYTLVWNSPEGKQQRESTEKTSLVICLSAIQMALSTVASSDDEIDQHDVVDTVLESVMEEEIYIELPKGFILGKQK